MAGLLTFQIYLLWTPSSTRNLNENEPAQARTKKSDWLHNSIQERQNPDNTLTLPSRFSVESDHRVIREKIDFNIKNETKNNP